MNILRFFYEINVVGTDFVPDGKSLNNSSALFALTNKRKEEFKISIFRIHLKLKVH